MSTQFTPPPTYAAVILYNESATDIRELLRSVRFNPIWLKWFVDVAEFITQSGGGGGGGANHNSLVGLQGGTTGEYYHFTAAEHTTLAALSGSGTTGSGAIVLADSPTLVTPDLGTPSALVATNASGTAASLTAGHVTTNANLTGPITSTGNVTAIAAQVGSGSTFVVGAASTSWTPVLKFGGGSTGITYSVQTGKYSYLGDCVFFSGRITLTNKGSSTGTATIDGLPVTVVEQTAVTMNGNNLGAGVSKIDAIADSGATTISMANFAAGAETNLADTDFNNNTTLFFSGVYHK